MSEDLKLTAAERKFADKHGFYDDEAKEWYAEIEKVYGKGKVPVSIDLGYVTDEKGVRRAVFEGPDGSEHSFIPQVDVNICSFAEKHGFDYVEAKVWYEQMEKVYGKGNVPVDAELGYVLGDNGRKICQFAGPDGEEHSFNADDDIRAALAAQRKISDMLKPRLDGGDERFGRQTDGFENEGAATVIRREGQER